MFTKIADFCRTYLIEPIENVLAYIVAMVWWIWKLSFDKDFRSEFLEIVQGAGPSIEKLIDSEFES